MPLDELEAPGVVECSYYVQDHLGNTRVVYQPVFCGVENASGEPIEYDVEYVGDYFPYAKTIREYIKGKKEKFLSMHHQRDEETGLDYRGARFYDADIGRFLSLDPLAADFANWSPYNYVLGNPVKFIDPDGRAPTQGDPPKTILIFYHGGPDGSGQVKQKSNDNTGYTGNIYNSAHAAAEASGRNVVGAIIAPAATQGPGVRSGMTFLKTHYKKGDQVIVYGYSYGGDNAVNLSERANKAGIPINTMVIVDSSDGPLGGTTVDTSVPDNVGYTLNVYQTGASGKSSSSQKSGGGPDSDNPNSREGSSSDGSPNSPGSRGYPHSAEGNNTVKNVNATGSKVNHGNIQKKKSKLITSTINNRIGSYGN